MLELDYITFDPAIMGGSGLSKHKDDLRGWEISRL